MHGTGTKTRANGTIIHSGAWRLGERQSGLTERAAYRIMPRRALFSLFALVFFFFFFACLHKWWKCHKKKRKAAAIINLLLLLFAYEFIMNKVILSAH